MVKRILAVVLDPNRSDRICDIGRMRRTVAVLKRWDFGCGWVEVEGTDLVIELQEGQALYMHGEPKKDVRSRQGREGRQAKPQAHPGNPQPTPTPILV